MKHSITNNIEIFLVSPLFPEINAINIPIAEIKIRVLIIKKKVFINFTNFYWEVIQYG